MRPTPGRSLVLPLLFSCMLFHARADDQKAPTIQVAHTWGDLVNSTPFELKDLPPGVVATANTDKDDTKSIPARLWVGIDRDHVASHGVLLLYCLSQKLDFSHTESRFGPFDVYVQNPSPNQMGEMDAMAQVMADNEAANQFYTYRIAVQETGAYIVELREPAKPGAKDKPRVYARIKVDVTAEVNPWTAWGNSPKEKALKDESNDVGTIVCNPTGGIAIPRQAEINEEGMSIPFNKFPSLDKPLPDIIPDQPDPAYLLKMEGDTLVLTLKPQDDNSETEDFYSWDDQFLTRWWVNDKPFIPALTAAKGDESLERSYKSDNPAREVRFQLDFHPERLGAKKGDKIGVQLLYCPACWDENGDGLEMSRDGGGAVAQRDLDLPPPEITYLSNRVDFVYTGDPKMPQQK